MTINGKVHCFFEQSGTFKNEFIKLGIPAEDYDIQDNFGETDHVINLFGEIEAAYEGGGETVFDRITPDDLIVAFFPCIHFCDAKTMFFKCEHIAQKNWSLNKKMSRNIEFAKLREKFYIVLLKLVAVCDTHKLRLIIENPWNTSRETYLQTNFMKPTFVDRNRAKRGDYYVKPTAYWFIGCEMTFGQSYKINENPKIVYKQHGNIQKTGICDEQRSMISPDYARNFICDFILGKPQKFTQLSLFDNI